MKFNIQAFHRDPGQDVQVGNVYRARGGAGPHYFVVASMTASGSSCHCLGIDLEGKIVSTATYGVHALAERACIGRAKLEDITIEIEEGTA